MDWSILIYSILSVIIISAASLIGIVTFMFKTKNLNKIVLYFVGFSVGALFGDVFIHILPESFELGNSTLIGLYVLAGIIFSFILEKIIHWRHCHVPETKKHHHSFAYMNLVGDSIHNFIDGVIIVASYFVSVPVGIATTFAVLLHEIPQELGDFGILIHGGFTKGKALFFNFITALTAVLGALVGFFLASSESVLAFMLPFAAGNLIYIAGTDLIPQLHSNTCETVDMKKNLLQLLMIILGIAAMFLLIFLE
jgi:zinc and cadmium transporter